MLLRQRLPSQSQHSSEPDLDALALRIRRLVLHKGYDRAAIASPLLKRLTPSRALLGTMADRDLRTNLKAAALDANVIDYLLRSVEAELDLARLRLT